MKRRDFLKKSALSAASFTIVPSFVLGGKHTPPSDTIYMAAVGVGGKGSSDVANLHQTGKVKFVAFADVDDKRAAGTYESFPDVKHYRDYRNIIDNHMDEIDAVSVSTPDHTHASIALPFMREKKHAFVQKPLTHNIYEARLMSETAKDRGIITQMGNQGSSSDGIRKTQEWINAGAIGKVHKVDCWTNRPVWPQGFNTVTEEEPVPEHLSWDVWLGPAAKRPYNSAYLPFKWRGFWDFGTGALGDMGCHIMETPFKTLGLGYPYEAEASCTTLWVDDFIESQRRDTPPPSSIVRLKFKNEKHGDISLNWYDGGMMPKLPDELKDGELPGDGSGGSIFYGEDGILITDTYSANPRLLPSDRMKDFDAPEPTIPRVKTTHQGDFVDGILGNSPTSSPFSYAGPLTEAVLMGNLAIKAYQYKELQDGKKAGDWMPYNYPGRKTIEWDGANMKVTNFDMANDWVRGTYREGWEL